MKRHVPQLTLIAVLMASGVFAAGLTPQSYVQDGLVAQFDAIDNGRDWRPQWLRDGMERPCRLRFCDACRHGMDRSVSEPR